MQMRTFITLFIIVLFFNTSTIDTQISANALSSNGNIGVRAFSLGRLISTLPPRQVTDEELLVSSDSHFIPNHSISGIYHSQGV